MAEGDVSADTSGELSALKHEMKNQKMKALPSTHTVQRRPLHHAPIASPFAGAHVSKVVYVSSHTPIMSAVKRVKKLLAHIEKRALQSADVKNRAHGYSYSELSDASDRLVKANEEVLVKASGRAMQQALRIGEWFRTRETDILCKVEVRASSVQAIDDLVEIEETEEVGSAEEHVGRLKEEEPSEVTTVLEGGETTMELLGNTTESSAQKTTEKLSDEAADQKQSRKLSSTTPLKKRKRARRKRAKYDEDDVPEARIRWVKTVEVAISLKA